MIYVPKNNMIDIFKQVIDTGDQTFLKSHFCLIISQTFNQQWKEKFGINLLEVLFFYPTT